MYSMPTRCRLSQRRWWHATLASLASILNDGYGKWDNGLMVGAVHPIQTVELLVELERSGYDGALYFDTFPDHSGLDPGGRGTHQYRGGYAAARHPLPD